MPDSMICASPKRVARLCGVSERHLYRAIREGELIPRQLTPSRAVLLMDEVRAWVLSKPIAGSARYAA
jgi:predicted DNA-binding transcriptional regulator AlpA